MGAVGDVLLLTGRPGVGKTTLVRRLAEAFPGRVGGFYTEEVREGSRRVGFVLATLQGERALFAHAAWGHAAYRVGRYGVDLEVLERVGVTAVQDAVRAGQAVLVDEVGKMELHSRAFREAVEFAAVHAVCLVATILAGRHPWADAFRARPGVVELVVTPANREEVLKVALRWLGGHLAPAQSRGPR